MGPGLSLDRTTRQLKSGIRVRRELEIAHPWPKLTLVGLSVRQAGDAEREDERPQPLGHVGGVFPGRDHDCVRITRRDDQSLGFWCAVALNIAPSWPKLTLSGLSGRRAGAVEREDESACFWPVWLHFLRPVFPRWLEDRKLRHHRQDDQSLGFGCAASSKSPLLGQN